MDLVPRGLAGNPKESVRVDVTPEVVDHVAQLALLQLDEAQRLRFTDQMNVILSYARKLYELDTTEIAPTTHVMSLDRVMRADEVTASLPLTEVFLNAPEWEGDAFFVPTVLE